MTISTPRFENLTTALTYSYYGRFWIDRLQMSDIAKHSNPNFKGDRPFFTAVYIVERLVLQTIHVLNKKILQFLSLKSAVYNQERIIMAHVRYLFIFLQKAAELLINKYNMVGSQREEKSYKMQISSPNTKLETVQNSSLFQG